MRSMKRWQKSRFRSQANRIMGNLEQKYLLQINMLKGGPESATKLAQIVSECVREYVATVKGNNNLPPLFGLLKRLNLAAMQKVRGGDG